MLIEILHAQITSSKDRDIIINAPNTISYQRRIHNSSKLTHFNGWISGNNSLLSCTKYLLWGNPRQFTRMTMPSLNASYSLSFFLIFSSQKRDTDTEQLDWKKLPLYIPRGPRLSLHNEDEKWREPIKALYTIVLWCPRGSRGPPKFSPMMPRDASLPDTCTPDRSRFPSLAEQITFSSWNFFQLLKAFLPN